MKKGYWRWGGQRGVCFTCIHEIGGAAGLQQRSVLPSILLATSYTQEGSREACKRVTTLPGNSFRASTHLPFFLSQRCLCQKQSETSGKIYSKLYQADK